MTVDEIEILKAYLVNESLRRDIELVDARQVYLHHAHDSYAFSACIRLLQAHIDKEKFDKISSDLCALLNI